MDEVVDAVSGHWRLTVRINAVQHQLYCRLDNFNFIHLNVIKTLRSMYPTMVLGLSDHTPQHATVLGAVALGASMIEKHFTDDVTRTGPDHAFSMDPITWRDMVDRTRELELAMGLGVKKVEHNELETVVVQRRSLRATSDFHAGHVIVERFCPVKTVSGDAISPAERKP